MLKIAGPDFVELECLACHMLQIVDIELVFQARDGGGRGLTAAFERVAAAGQHRLLIEPDDVRRDLIGDRGRLLDPTDDVAAAGVDFLGKGERDGIAAMGNLKVAVGGDDARHMHALARRLDHHLIAWPDLAARNRAGVSAEVEMRPVHPLHGEAERLLLLLPCDINRLEMPEQRGASVPMHMRAGDDHIVALQRRYRDAGDCFEAERLGEALEILGDRIEARLAEIDEIHLVHGKRELADAEQRDDAGVPPRLGEHAAPRIDQEHGEVAIGRSGRHVARVLHMPRRIGDDEFAARRREIAISHVDGDLLLAFGLQAIDQQREVERTVAAGPLGIALGAFQLVVVDLRRVVEQPPDQRALAVIHAAAGEKAQKAAIFLGDEALLQPLLSGSVTLSVDNTQPWHQKYPSCFFFSIDPV